MAVSATRPDIRIGLHRRPHGPTLPDIGHSFRILTGTQIQQNDATTYHSGVLMALTTPNGTSSDIAQREFALVRRGYDPSEVRAFLADVASHNDPFATLGAEVAGVLETAQRSADQYAEIARAEADAYVATLRAEADAYVATLRAEADAAAAAILAEATTDAARCRDEAMHLLAETEAACAQLRVEVEIEVRTQTQIVLDESQRRLDRAMIAECEVRDRLRAALKMVEMDDQMPSLLHSTDGVLDEAFAEFVSDNVEAEPSREWILSD
jgi:DivIVA domain-containing protein